jgi:hypothetical protein
MKREKHISLFSKDYLKIRFHIRSPQLFSFLEQKKHPQPSLQIINVRTGHNY